MSAYYWKSPEAFWLVTLVPLGVAIRKANYVNAEPRDVARGGLIFNADGNKGTIVLMGDSHGSMYGQMVREASRQLRRRQSSRTSSMLWVREIAGAQPVSARSRLASPTSIGTSTGRMRSGDCRISIGRWARARNASMTSWIDVAFPEAAL